MGSSSVVILLYCYIHYIQLLYVLLSLLSLLFRNVIVCHTCFRINTCFGYYFLVQLLYLVSLSFYTSCICIFVAWAAFWDARHGPDRSLPFNSYQFTSLAFFSLLYFDCLKLILWLGLFNECLPSAELWEVLKGPSLRVNFEHAV